MSTRLQRASAKVFVILPRLGMSLGERKKKNGFMVTSQAGDVAFEEERIILRRKTRRGTGGGILGDQWQGRR